MWNVYTQQWARRCTQLEPQVWASLSPAQRAKVTRHFAPKDGPGLRVRVSTRMVGMHFGVVGVVRGLRGRLLVEGRVCPYGHTESARENARAIAEQRGWVVVE